MKLKKVVPSFLSFFAVIVPALLKRPPAFVLWYKDLVGLWVIKSKPISYRQCRKTKTALVALGGYHADRFAILRDGTKP